MKSIKYVILSATLAAAVMAVAPSAVGQQINGTPGTPNATVTIDGKQIPPPPMPFGGVINESVKNSKPYWPPRVVAPKSAPNILLVLIVMYCTMHELVRVIGREKVLRIFFGPMPIPQV